MPNIKIDIYILNTNIIDGKSERILPIIAPRYAEKYKNAKALNVKNQELCAGYLLYKYLGITKDEQLSTGEHGKPLLKEQAAGNTTEFSISHSDSYVVLAVSNTPVGVDIERADRITMRVLKRVLPADHYEGLIKKGYAGKSELENNDKLVLAKSWTSVEAVLKAIGSGFHLDPRENASFMNDWCIESLVIDDNFVLSCASKYKFTINLIKVDSL